VRHAALQEVASSAAQGPSTYTPPHLAKAAVSNRFALEGERKLVTVMFLRHRETPRRLR
jgi:hypothetical protein